MIKSMTAFGRAEKVSQGVKVVFEIHSVNRKNLDVVLQIPKDLLRFDIEIREKIQTRVQRGAVTVRWMIGEGGAAFPALSKRLKPFKAAWDKLAKDLGMEPVSLPFLLQQLSSEEVRPEDRVIRSTLEVLLDQALKEFDERKKKEGKVLGKDIENRLKEVEASLKKIEKNAPNAVQKYREKLLERIREIAFDCEDRVFKEVAIFAEKVDITEELVRLSSHLKQFREEMKKEGSVGRTLDFLIQEMNREVNTIGSKSSDREISSLVIQIKGELEKIREQVQNIE